MDPLWSETRWSTFKYFIILIVSTYYISCISWLIKCLIIIEERCKHEDKQMKIWVFILCEIYFIYAMHSEPLHFPLLAVICRHILSLVYNSVLFTSLRLQTLTRFLNSLLLYITKYTTSLRTTTNHLNTLVKHILKCPVVYKNIPIAQ